MKNLLKILIFTLLLQTLVIANCTTYSSSSNADYYYNTLKNYNVSSSVCSTRTTPNHNIKTQYCTSLNQILSYNTPNSCSSYYRSSGTSVQKITGCSSTEIVITDSCPPSDEITSQSQFKYKQLTSSSNTIITLNRLATLTPEEQQITSQNPPICPEPYLIDSLGVPYLCDDDGNYSPTDNPRCMSSCVDNGTNCVCGGDTEIGVYPYYAFPEPEPVEEEPEEEPENPDPIPTPPSPDPDTGGSTGGDTGGNTGGSTGGDTGGDTGGSSGGTTGGTTGGDTGGDTGDTGGSSGGTDSVSSRNSSSTPPRPTSNNDDIPINDTEMLPNDDELEPIGEGVDLSGIESTLVAMANDMKISRTELKNLRNLSKNMDKLQYLEYLTDYINNLKNESTYQTDILTAQNENMMSTVEALNDSNSLLNDLKNGIQSLSNFTNINNTDTVNNTNSNFENLTNALNNNTTNTNSTLESGFSDLVENINNSSTSQNEILESGFSDVVSAIESSSVNVDMSTTNETLSSINNTLQSLNSSDNASFIEDSFSNIVPNLQTLVAGFGNTFDNFNDIHNAFNNGFTSNIQSQNISVDCLRVTIMGALVDFNSIFTVFDMIKPLVSMLFQMMFMYLTIVILYKALVNFRTN